MFFLEKFETIKRHNRQLKAQFNGLTSSDKSFSLSHCQTQWDPQEFPKACHNITLFGSLYLFLLVKLLIDISMVRAQQLPGPVMPTFLNEIKS